MEESKSYVNGQGNKIWYLPSKGKYYWHRIGGPALEHVDGHKEWYVDNKRHRLDGPAIKYADGSKEWWIDDIHLNREKTESWLEENNIDLKTEAGQFAFKMVFS